MGVTDELDRVVARLRSHADGQVEWQRQALPADPYVARTAVVWLLKAH